MSPLVVTIMGQDCKDFLEICLASIKEADAILYVDGGSANEFKTWLRKQNFRDGFLKDVDGDVDGIRHTRYWIQKWYDPEDPNANSTQRNYYLDYLKQHYMGWDCLALDADECVSDGGIANLKAFLAGPLGPENPASPGVYSVHMRHLIGDFTHEDATKERHYVPNRLFRITNNLAYPAGEHVVLEKSGSAGSQLCDAACIFHLAYAPMFHVRNRYEKNLTHSNVHSREFLESWMRAHILGQYPRKELDPRDLPSALLEAFHIDPDELYFAQRGLETKHYQMTKAWLDHLFPNDNAFRATQLIHILDLGCGRGPYLAGWKHLDCEVVGIEKSPWAAAHPVWGVSTKDIEVGDICEMEMAEGETFDLVTLIDVLEHIPEPDFHKAVENAIKASKKYLLVSAPFLGDSNLFKDPTHCIFKEKSWWIAQFENQGLKILSIPEDWIFKEQLLLFEKEENGEKEQKS